MTVKPFGSVRPVQPTPICGVSVGASWHAPVACAYPPEHQGPHSWSSIPALPPKVLGDSPWAEVLRLRELSLRQTLTQGDNAALAEIADHFHAALARLAVATERLVGDRSVSAAADRPGSEPA